MVSIVNAFKVKNSSLISKGVACLSSLKTSKMFGLLLLTLFIGGVFSSCDKAEEDILPSPASPAYSAQKAESLSSSSETLRLASSEWYSYPSWSASPISSKTFKVNNGKKALVTVINQGKTALKVLVKQVGTGYPAEEETIERYHVESILLDPAQSGSIHVSVYSGESNGDFVGGKADVRVSYWK